MLSKFRSLMKDESGATAIEYALLLAMAAVIIATFSGPIQTRITTIFTNIQNAL